MTPARHPMVHGGCRRISSRSARAAARRALAPASFAADGGLPIVGCAPTSGGEFGAIRVGPG